ncbi:DoxX family protein [Flagellimonas olearia]|uniref:DoxX family protein n=1 Tax=Flagellimonas olearia TaxID=552546 RepID=A0A6I1EAV5_9FLAO|nr:DoxX family protein [Allomuricauda olearia]KAB7530894.1 DoxX family protein [Allomuricauda olearia]
MTRTSIIHLLLKIIAAVILLQTLYFKFTAAPESVYIFETLGLEPVERIGIGVLELLTAILLLVPRTTGLGAVLGMGILGGAIFSHLTQLGIEVQNDGGTLFILAVITFIICCYLAWHHRFDIPILKNLLGK